MPQNPIVLETAFTKNKYICPHISIFVAIFFPNLLYIKFKIRKHIQKIFEAGLMEIPFFYFYYFFNSFIYFILFIYFASSYLIFKMTRALLSHPGKRSVYFYCYFYGGYLAFLIRR